MSRSLTISRSLCLSACILFIPILFFPGCNDDAPVGKDGGMHDGPVDVLHDGTGEKGAHDGKPTDSAPAGLGEGCTSQAECTNYGLLCVMYSSLFSGAEASGICTKECTLDDSTTTTTDEDTCPGGFRCAKLGSNSKYCFKKCTPSATQNPCPASSGQACDPISTAYLESLTTTVCLRPACKADKDCPVHAGVHCIWDSDCTSLGSGAFCGYSNRCALPGKCTASGLCGTHSRGKQGSKVGDPCTGDVDCPNNGECIEESWGSSVAVGNIYPNGYCIVRNCSFSDLLPEYKCPTGSTCHLLYYTGLCFKTCILTDATTCRNYAKDKGGDYECYSWDKWQVSSTKVTAEPVCLNASTQTCDRAPGGSTATCAGLGDSLNSTQMSCRERYMGLSKSNPQDSTGICLDNTASGLFTKPTPDGGMDGGMDGGVDGGVEAGPDASPHVGPEAGFDGGSE